MIELITPNTDFEGGARPEIVTTSRPQNPEQYSLDALRNSHYYPLRGMLAEMCYFDHQNGPHGLRVACSYEQTVTELAGKLRFPHNVLGELMEYRYGAVMHDLTKVAVLRNFNDSIVTLNGNFSAGSSGEDTRTEEFKLLCESHTVLAPYVFRILEDLTITKKQAVMTRDIARQHHNFDGPPILGARSVKHSYPDTHIQYSKNLPYFGTANLIMSLCDINDALSVERDYQKNGLRKTKIQKEEIIDELIAHATPERIKSQTGKLIDPTPENRLLIVESVMASLPQGYNPPEPETLMWGDEPFIRRSDMSGKTLDMLVNQTWQLYQDEILRDTEQLYKSAMLNKSPKPN